MTEKYRMVQLVSMKTIIGKNVFMQLEGHMVNRSGVTVIEACLVLAILTIVMAVSYPSMRNWMQRQRFRGQVYALVGDLNKAKMAAIATNSLVAVVTDPKGYSIFVDNGDGPREKGDWVRESDEKLLGSRNFKANLNLFSTYSRDRVRFRSTPGVKAGRFVATDGNGHRMEIVISVMGRIRVM